MWLNAGKNLRYIHISTRVKLLEIFGKVFLSYYPKMNQAEEQKKNNF